MALSSGTPHPPHHLLAEQRAKSASLKVEQLCLPLSLAFMKPAAGCGVLPQREQNTHGSALCTDARVHHDLPAGGCRAVDGTVPESPWGRIGWNGELKCRLLSLFHPRTSGQCGSACATRNTPVASKAGLIICCSKDFTLRDPWHVSKGGS